MAYTEPVLTKRIPLDPAKRHPVWYDEYVATGGYAALRKAKGAGFDHLFLTGMIQHHNGALTMVKDLFDTAGAGQDADLFNFATDADNTQRAEIRIMQAMLEKKSLEEKR